MKKTFIIGFILLSIAVKGEMGTNIKQNKMILDNIKTQNAQLREEIKRLTQILDKLEINLVREVKFEDLGVEIRRDMKSFTLKIINEDLSKGEYNKVLDNFIEITKYNSKDPIIFEGNQLNTEFLRTYFNTKGFDPTRITIIINEDKKLVTEEKEIKEETKIESNLVIDNIEEEKIKIVETKIILNKEK